jgi:hypothetical protein
MAEEAPHVVVLYSPPGLADGDEAGEELDRISKEIAGGRQLDKEALTELRASGWLRQVRWRRGGYFTTTGLRNATGNPDLVLLNVPGAFAPWALQLLKHIADYLVESGARLQPGEVFALPDPGFPDMAVTFDLIEPGDLQLPEFAHPMLIVVPLP